MPVPIDAAHVANLDAMARLGALLCQIAALRSVSDLPDGQTAEVIHDGARVRIVGDQATALAEALMDAKDTLIGMLATPPRACLGSAWTRCVGPMRTADN
jgi:hypothetical protein